MLPEVVIQLGAVPLAAYGLPGTPALSAGMLPYIPEYDAMLLRESWLHCLRPGRLGSLLPHGDGGTFCSHHLCSGNAGGARALPRDEVKKLFDARARYNVNSKAQMVARNAAGSRGLLLSEELNRRDYLDKHFLCLYSVA